MVFPLFLKTCWCLLSAAICSTTLLAIADEPNLKGGDGTDFDIVVYGGTSAGVTAAIQAKRMGRSVVLIEPGQHLGGLTSGGLGATDIGNKRVIGGLSRTFYRNLGTYYSHNSAWTQGTLQDLRAHYRNRMENTDQPEIWVFEPHVAERVFAQMLSRAKVPVMLNTRLDLNEGVKKQGPQIVSLAMENGRTIHGRMFIDATYEGDLMAGAGVAYHVGREANAKHGETLNGVATRQAVSHQFVEPVDPYIRKGDPSSGLLPGVGAHGPGDEGAGDSKIQAYCYRMCTTDVVENQRDWVKPKQYDPQRYELLLRNFEAGDHRIPWNPIWLPNHKTDTNNNFAISTDNIGMNYDYPEGNYATREKILLEHLTYQQGLMWTLAYHPRVPAKVRQHFQQLKPTKDEFVDHDGWPHQLYVREARRMIADVVMTQNHCQGRELVEDAIGMAAYGMDSHNIQRYVQEGRVLNEGDVQVGGFAPYPISYRSIRPRKEECTNLLVPICVSASHIAYGSIRMEPVFMVLGQSAATAAAQAIEQSIPIQEIEYSQLKKRLLEDGQILRWNGPRPKPPLDPKTLPGIVIDEPDAQRIGFWKPSHSFGGFVGQAYIHDSNRNKGSSEVRYATTIENSGTYEVRLYFLPASNRATRVPVTMTTALGVQKIIVNQQKRLSDQPYLILKSVSLEAGEHFELVISNKGTDGYVIADAVQLVIHD
ncbi:MAG: FAD-dependent oxidoreductase [Pirellulales bacterium]